MAELIYCEVDLSRNSESSHSILYCRFNQLHSSTIHNNFSNSIWHDYVQLPFRLAFLLDRELPVWEIYLNWTGSTVLRFDVRIL